MSSRLWDSGHSLVVTYVTLVCLVGGERCCQALASSGLGTLGVLFPFGSYFRIKVKQDVVTLKYRASLP